MKLLQGWIFYIVLWIIAGLFLVFAINVRAEEIDLAIIAQIESNNNPNAYVPGEEARGLYQITPICLKEYNNFHPNATMPVNALYLPSEARKVAGWYLRVRIPQMLKYYGLEANLDNILWAYNAGIGNVVKGILPDSTKLYIRKYKRLLK